MSESGSPNLQPQNPKMDEPFYVRFPNSVLRWINKKLTHSTLKEIERQNIINHTISEEIELKLHGSVKDTIGNRDLSDIINGKTASMKYYIKNPIICSHRLNPITLEAGIGDNNLLGLNYWVTNHQFQLHSILKIWKAETLPPVPINIAFGAYYLHDSMTLHGFMEAAAGNMLKARVEGFLGSNPGLIGSLLFTRGNIGAAITMKRNSIEVGGYWEGEGVGVALKGKHCPHYKHAVAKLEVYNMQTLIKKVSINTKGTLAGEIATNVGNTQYYLRGTYSIKDSRFGLKCGYGSSY